MSFPVTVGLGEGDQLVTSTNSTLRALGTKGTTPDGKVFRWALNGSVALQGGVLIQGAPPNASQDAGLAIVNATTTGVSSLSVTTQAATTRDQYKDGYLTVDTSPGQALFQIASNTSGASGANVEVKFKNDAKIREAMTSGTTTVGLYESPYKNTIVAPTTITGPVVGVSPGAVDSAVYFWAQTAGWALANCDVAPAVNTALIFGGTSAGHLNARTSALNDIPEIEIGRSITAGAGADAYNFIQLALE